MFASIDFTAESEISFAMTLVTPGTSRANLIDRSPVADNASKIEIPSLNKTKTEN